MPLLGSHAISTAVRDVHRVRGEPALPDKRALPGPQIKEAKRSIDLFASTALLLSRLVTTFSSFLPPPPAFSWRQLSFLLPLHYLLKEGNDGERIGCRPSGTFYRCQTNPPFSKAYFPSSTAPVLYLQ
jgi:hypothetical protein